MGLSAVLSEYWPTWQVNVLSALFLLVPGLIIRVPAYEPKLVLRTFERWTWDDPGYWQELWVEGDTFMRLIFVLWTFEIIVTLGVVFFHLLHTHHPKFYISTMNKVSIIMHMIGGTTGILGYFIGVIIDSKLAVLLAFCGGFFLHLPTVLWQMRSVHGRQEVIIPSYVLMACLLFLKHFDVITDNASLSSVIGAAHALHVFSYVRLWGAILSAVGTDVHESHDRALIFSGVVKVPFVLGPFGALTLPGFICLWNYFVYLIPCVPRPVLQVNRMFTQIFSEADGAAFKKELERIKKAHPDADEDSQIALAAFRIISGKDGRIDRRELEALLLSWGIPEADQAAERFMASSDGNHDGTMDYEEFKKNMWFIVKSIGQKSEANLQEHAKGRLEGRWSIVDTSGHIDRIFDTEQAADEVDISTGTPSSPLASASTLVSDPKAEDSPLRIPLPLASPSTSNARSSISTPRSHNGGESLRHRNVPQAEDSPRMPSLPLASPSASNVRSSISTPRSHNGGESLRHRNVPQARSYRQCSQCHAVKEMSQFVKDEWICVPCLPLAQNGQGH